MPNQKEVLKCYDTRSKSNFFLRSSSGHVVFSVPVEYCIYHSLFK